MSDEREDLTDQLGDLFRSVYETMGRSNEEGWKAQIEQRTADFNESEARWVEAFREAGK